MDISVETLWAMPEPEMIELYHRLRRAYAEKRFARDTERGRLNWQRARTFLAAKGGVSERQNAVDASEELANKGQHVRELTLEHDLIKCDIDAVAAAMRMRGFASSPTTADEQTTADAGS
ncbi:MAG TPA: hypothetical protein VJ748_03060 [Vitreimonas sp.]|jgi:hypothetical protein|nr:hypothetical protein [Vitreimonas sp.]